MTDARRSRRLAGLLAAALAAVLAAAAPAAAQGWLAWDQSAAAMGRGGAMTAAADDPSAAFYNPAGISSLFGTHVRVDLSTAARGGEFESFEGGSFDRSTLDVAGGIYATHAVAAGVTLGLSINAPWGFSVEWDRPSEFAGRFRVTDGSLRSIVVSPVLAWQARPDLAVGGGVVLTYALLDLRRFEQIPDFSAIGGVGPIALARSTYELDGLGAGWVVGATYRVDDRLSVGASARSGLDLDLVGPAAFVDVAPRELRDFLLPGRDRTIGEILDRLYAPGQNARLPFRLPRVVSGGVAWVPVERVRLTADLQWAGWDDADSLALDFVNDTLDDRQRLGFEDAWAVRAGVEVRHRPGQAIRLGFAHEESPASGAAIPLVPDAARNALSAGYGWTAWRDVSIDLAWRVAFLEDREGVALPGNDSPEGTYESTEHRFMVGISRRF